MGDHESSMQIETEIKAGQVTPPILQGPTSKERKYDRQLRLWAANGQAALEDAHVLLINSGCGAVGVEALKNLILPAIGQYTILDPFLVTEADLGVNFFLTEEDVGFSRAERLVKSLNELNPDVRGHAIKDDISAFLTKSPFALDPYSLILVILPAGPIVIQQLAVKAQTSHTPIFFIHSLGFYSHFTLRLPSTFPIVDIHPDPTTNSDLRLSQPWPELIKLMETKTLDMEAMNDDDHGHVPYLIILLHFVQQWKHTHNGSPPKSYKEKSELKQIVQKGMRTSNAEGGEENWEEAVAAVMRSFNSPEPSSSLRAVFEANECSKDLHGNSPDFWIIARAVHEFVKQNGVVPLPGSLPDMKARSADYVELQNMYKNKARADVNEVAEFVDRIQTSFPPGTSSKVIPRQDIEAFCKNANYVKLIRGSNTFLSDPDPSKLFSRLNAEDIALADAAYKRANNAVSDETSLIALSFCFQAYDRLSWEFLKYDSCPPQGISPLPDTEESINTLTESALREAVEVLQRSGKSALPEGTQALVHNIATDLVHAQGCELHNIASLTGGMVAQEAIKVITKQYVPIENTCLFDGVKSRTSILRL